jgi:hypothetical protein
MKLRLGFVAALVLTSAAAFNSPAGAANTSSTSLMSPKGDENCMIVLTPMQKGDTESQVVEQRCSSDPADLAPDAMYVKLITWYDNANYVDPHIDVYGIYGSCDRYGYGIHDVGAGWAARISSFEVYGSCIYTDVWDQTDYNGNWTVYAYDVAWVGSVWNDRIRSMWVSA